MIKTALITLASLTGLVLVAGWLLTRAHPLPDDAMAGLSGDPAAGEQVFLAAGCGSCHSAPEGDSDGPPVLAGGQRFKTAFGTFVAPNISPDPDHGIGAWSDLDIVSATMGGVSPSGTHYFPAFPYIAYGKATLADMTHLVAYLRTLPPAATPSQPHEVAFPFNIRRSVGVWKQLFMSDDWVLEDATTPALERGRYLVEALTHCGECHTPRNALGGLDRSRWLGGAADPAGDGKIPAIDPGALDWSDTDVIAYLKTGLTPDYDSAGGHMVNVIDNLSQLPDSDLAAIVAYLRAVPAISP